MAGRARDTKVKSHTLGVLTLKKAEKEKKRQKKIPSDLNLNLKQISDLQSLYSLPPGHANVINIQGRSEGVSGPRLPQQTPNSIERQDS